jgi:hypothetical protein
LELKGDGGKRDSLLGDEVVGLARNGKSKYMSVLIEPRVPKSDITSGYMHMGTAPLLD